MNARDWPHHRFRPASHAVVLAYLGTSLGDRTAKGELTRIMACEAGTAAFWWNSSTYELCLVRTNGAQWTIQVWRRWHGHWAELDIRSERYEHFARARQQHAERFAIANHPLVCARASSDDDSKSKTMGWELDALVEALQCVTHVRPLWDLILAYAGAELRAVVSRVDQQRIDRLIMDDGLAGSRSATAFDTL